MGWGRDVYSTRTEGRRAIERSYILPRPSEAPLAFLSTPAGGGATGGKAAAACKKRRRSMQPKAAQAFAVDSTSPVFSSTQQMVRISRHAVVAPPLGRWPQTPTTGMPPPWASGWIRWYSWSVRGWADCDGHSSDTPARTGASTGRERDSITWTLGESASIGME